MNVIKLINDDSLTTFCKECSIAGYTNNISIATLKLSKGHDLPSDPQYWGLVVDNQLASISGCHSYDDKHEILRCLFRSATLPKYHNLITGTSKTHMNSAPFSLLLPKQIEWGLVNNYKQFYITTSHGSHDASGHMYRTHRALELLAKQGIVDYVRTEEYYYTPQTLWSVNLDRYWQAWKVFKQSHSDIVR